MDRAEAVVKLGLGAIALAGGLLMHTCITRNVEAQGGRIEVLLNDLKSEQLHRDPWTSMKLPQAEGALKLETKNYIFNFVMDSKEDPHGLLLVFSKSSGDGSKFAKVNSKGKVIGGSALIAKEGLSQLRKKYPESLDGQSNSGERADP